MREIVYGFDQNKMVYWGLNVDDILILRWLLDYCAINNSLKDYNEIIDALPIIKSNITCFQRKFKRYIELGLIENNTSDIVEILKNKELSNKGFGSKKCDWCGINTICLHSHHYPIPKKDNGTKTVNICPNCHSEYHCFINIVPTNKLKQAEKESSK